MAENAKQIFRALKLQGLTLHADAIKRLLSELENQPGLELDDVIYAIKNSIDRSKRMNVLERMIENS